MDSIENNKENLDGQKITNNQAAKPINVAMAIVLLLLILGLLVSGFLLGWF